MYIHLIIHMYNMCRYICIYIYGTTDRVPTAVFQFLASGRRGLLGLRGAIQRASRSHLSFVCLSTKLSDRVISNGFNEYALNPSDRLCCVWKVAYYIIASFC